MLRFLRENLVLKIISLLASVVMWLYVTADRYPSTVILKMVNAEPVRVGAPPQDLVIRFRPDSIPVEISGPKNEVDAIAEGDVKAEIDVHNVHAGASQLKVLRYRMPTGAPNIEVKNGRRVLVADVLPRVRRSMQISAELSSAAPNGRRYGTAHVNPEWASVTGVQEDVKRIQKLVVLVETNGLAVSEDLPIKAVDKDGVEVPGVDIQPLSAHVELALPETPATRTLVVNVPHRVKTTGPYQISEIVVEPSQVTVIGKPEQLLQMTNVSTQEIVIDGLTGESSRDVSLQLPAGVTVANGRPMVHVTFKVRDITKPSPATTDGR